MKLLFFQYGDFGEAYGRLQNDGSETYRDQRASVDFVASLSPMYEVTTVAICHRVHWERLSQNLYSIGVSEEDAQDSVTVSHLLNVIAPDLIICRTPNYWVIRSARRRRIPTLLVFADFFANDSLTKIWQHLTLRILLDRAVFPCIANHNLNASISVSKTLFYPKSRIVPWDWTKLVADGVAKRTLANPRCLSVFFAGALVVEKGIDDCLRAIPLLRQRGVNSCFTLAGPGDVKRWERRANELGVGSQVVFVGTLSNEAVRERMVKSDVIVVPSHHDYAEGLPNVIYEALASRTPLVISDHPAFSNRLTADESCLVFKAADPSALADSLSRLVADVDLFTRLSESSAAAHDLLYVGMKWVDLISIFLRDPKNLTHWVEANSLARLDAAGSVST